MNNGRWFTASWLACKGNNMFDLEQAIANWRREMLAAGIQTPVPLEELESHLREDVEQHLREGLSAQQAFETAVGRMGQAGSLKLEFKKGNGVDKARLRRRGIFAFALIFVFYAVTFVCILLKNDLTFHERWAGFASVATTLLSLYAAWQILPRFFPVITRKSVQSVIGLAGGISGMGWLFVFVHLILPRCDFTPGQLLVALSWALVPTLVLPAAAFLALDKSERQASASTSS